VTLERNGQAPSRPSAIPSVPAAARPPPRSREGLDRDGAPCRGLLWLPVSGEAAADRESLDLVLSLVYARQKGLAVSPLELAGPLLSLPSLQFAVMV
jgi:hypothetical protein